MSQNIFKTALLNTTITLSLLGQNNEPIQATTFNYDFTVDIISGPLLNNTYYGTLSYDYVVPPLTGVGIETTPLVSFNFSFAGNTYTRSDDPTSVARFSDGVFVGTDYAVSNPPAPTLLAGDVMISDAVFFYDTTGTGAPNTQGQGKIIYGLNAMSVPEPLTILGSMTALLFAAGLKRRLN